MKTFRCFKNGCLGVLVLGLVFTSCSDAEDTVMENHQLEAALELKRSAEMDQIDTVLADVIIEAYEAEEASLANRNLHSRAIPDCVTITVVAQQNYRQVTVDFGSEGCVIQGHLIQGQLVFDYTKLPEAQQIRINYNLLNFYFDAKQVIGSRSILKELSSANGNPQFTHNINVTVIWPNGAQASREGTRVRAWVEGFGSGVFSDNVFEITGSWTATFINGNVHSYEVIAPLRREVGCAYVVSGSFSVDRPNFGGVFDYGDGTCDNLATMTFNNGQETAITLN